MIAAWMIYCMAVGLAVCLAGWAAERALYLARLPTRWAWSVALLLTVALPAAAWLRPQAFGSITIPLAQTASTPGHASPPASENAMPVNDAPQVIRHLSWADMDVPLMWGWGVASACALVALAIAGARLAMRRRQWRHVHLDGRSVLVARDVGPAVVGLWSPAVVIPQWALALTDHQKCLMLSHEEEHVRSGDPWLLAGGTVALIAAPWNPALWWLVRRLRHAVEMDCDGRVVKAGHGPLDYGELLLRVGQRRAHLPFAAVAMSEPRSLLELRIRRLAARPPRRRWLGVSVTAFVATATIVAACETPRPVSPQLAAHSDPVGRPAVIPLIARATAESLNARATRSQYHPGVFMYWTDYADTIRIPAERKPQDQPELLSGPELPSGVGELLGHAGIGGRVVVRAIVDPSGRAEPASVHVIATLHPAADQIAKAFILGARFRPALVDGRAVRASLELPVDFSPHVTAAPSQLDKPSSGPESYSPDGDYLLRLAREYDPEVFTSSVPHAAVALVFDAEHRVVAHAAGEPEAGDPDCLAVVQRLVPAYANSRWSSSGCSVDLSKRVIVYWKALR